MDISPKKPDLTEEDISIVLIGDFNPVIFHPTWFAQHELIRVNEANDATIDVVAQDISSFRLEWISFQILRDRFTATIKADAYKTHLGDIVQGLFSILSHTPVKQLGINTTFKCEFKSNDDWHSFGHFLIPKSPWVDVLSKPGMRGMQIQGIRDDDRPGFTILSVDPDLVLAVDTVFIRVNDHYENPQSLEKGVISSKWAVDILYTNYKNSIDKAESMISKLIDNFIATKTVDSTTATATATPIKSAESIG